MTPTALSWALGHIKQGQANHSGKMFSVECSTHARVSSTPQIPFQSAALLLLLLAQLIPICRIKLGAPPKGNLPVGLANKPQYSCKRIRRVVDGVACTREAVRLS